MLEINEQYKSWNFRRVFRRFEAFKLEKGHEQEKLSQLQLQSVVLAQKRLVCQLKVSKERKFNLVSYAKIVRSDYLMNLLKHRLRDFKEWQKNCSLLKTELAQKHELYLIRCAWKGL
jgi:hypothetical protein